MILLLVLLTSTLLEATPLPSTEWEEVAKMLSSAMDLNAKPCEDFYQFACGNWAKTRTTKTRINTMLEQQYAVLAKLGNLLTSLDPKKHIRAGQQLKIYFDLCLKTKAVDLKPDYIMKLLDGYGKWPLLNQDWKGQVGGATYKNASALIGQLMGSLGTATFLTATSTLDYRDPTKSLIAIQPASNQQQTIVNKDSTLVGIKSQIKDNTTALAKAAHIDLNYTKLDDEAKDLAVIEYHLFELLKPVQINVPTINVPHEFHTIKTAQVRWPYFDWKSLLIRVGEGNFNTTDISKQTFIVQYPEILTNMTRDIIDKYIKKDPRKMQNFLLWRVVEQQFAFASPSHFARRKFKLDIENFEPQNMSDVCAMKAMGLLPLATGRLFVDYFKAQMPDNTVSTAKDMVAFVLAAFEGMLYKLKWLDQASKKAAMDKLSTLVRVIAYDKYVTNDEYMNQLFSTLNLTKTDSMFVMLNKLTGFNVFLDLHIVGVAVDRQTMGTPPGVVNAGYIPSLNHIEVPAATLGKNMFYPGRPLAVNYGMLGAVLGHEITHGFDTNGVHYDAKGIYSEKGWLSDKSKKDFDKMAKCVVVEYDKFCYDDKRQVCVNGSRTVGENIADAGGLMAAYKAYKNVIELSGKEPKLPEPMPQDLSMEKVFFISFAHTWCNKVSKEYLPISLQDTHAPDLVRVNGTLKNIPEFGIVFKCTKGQPMYPENHCNVWVNKT